MSPIFYKSCLSWFFATLSIKSINIDNMNEIMHNTAPMPNVTPRPYFSYTFGTINPLNAEKNIGSDALSPIASESS